MNDELKGLSLAELLDKIEPIREPAPISMFPQTSGWIVLGLLLLVILVSTCLMLQVRRQRNGYRRAAIKEIEAVRNDPVALARLLRRTALAAFHRQDVASLTGSDWLSFLAAKCPKHSFTEQEGKILSHGPYQRTRVEFPLAKPVLAWVKWHKRSQGKNND